MINVMELKGYDALRAYYAYVALLLGINMLPEYMMETPDSFLKRVQELPDDKLKELLYTGAKIVELDKPSVEALVCFCKDKNGIPYRAENIKNLNPLQMIDLIVAVCFEISKIKIDLVSDAEKKN